MAGVALLLLAGITTGAVMIPWEKANPFHVSQEDRLKRIMARDQMSRLSIALESYKKDNGVFPTTEQGLEALITAPSMPPLARMYFEGGYIDRISIPRDPWGRQYVYEQKDGSYYVRSQGRLGWYSGDDLVQSETRTLAEKSEN